MQLVEGAEHLGLRGQRRVVAVVALVHDPLPVGVEVDGALLVCRLGLPARAGRAVSAVSASRASATSIVAACLAASKPRTLMLTNRTSGLAKIVWLAVVKSEYRVPMPMTTSASRARALAADEPVEPTPPTALRWSQLMAPLPAWVSATGMPVAVANARSCSEASEYTTPPPATTRGPCAERMTSTARARAGRLGHGAADVPHPPAEQLHGPVEGLGLDVLGEGDRHGTGVDRVGEDPHGVHHRRDELLGAVDPVEEA